MRSDQFRRSVDGRRTVRNSKLLDGGPTFSDNGNAARFVFHHGKDLLHVTMWGRWLVWDGRRWAIDTTAEVVRRAKNTVTRIYHEAARASDSKRKEIGRHALRSESERAIKAMIALAESELAAKPDDLDADPWLLNVANGTVNLRSGTLVPHERRNLVTKLAPVDFDQRAVHPAWDAFLELMLPDPDLRAFIQRAVGYSLTGDTREEKLFFVYGPTASGKSTFTGALASVLGDYAVTCDFESFLRRRGDAGIRNDLARLAGARMALSLEMDEGRALAEALVKNLTGGDVITARRLYQEFFEFRPSFKLWLVANHKPIVSAQDSALWRRILLIPFEHSLPESRRDPAVKATLIQDGTARAAILAWAVRGLQEWREHGLQVPAAVQLATEAYRDEQDALAPFLADCSVLGPEAWVPSKDLREAYGRWCEQSGEPQLGGRAFARALREHGCEPRPSPDHGKARGWAGIRLRDLIDAPGPGDADACGSTYGKVLHEGGPSETCSDSRPQLSACSPGREDDLWRRGD